MILVDTSVWVDHFRKSDPGLTALLSDGDVLIHPLIIEELACGSLPSRQETLGLLATLPAAPTASHDEILSFIESQSLFGTGLGAADVHLLACTRLAAASIWTRDRALARAAKALGILAQPENQS